jgi:serine protease
MASHEETWRYRFGRQLFRRVDVMRRGTMISTRLSHLLTGSSIAGALCAATLLAFPAGAGAAVRYAPDEVIVGYAPGPSASAAADVATTMGIRQGPTPTERIVRLPPGMTVPQAIARLRRTRGVAYAVPDYLAHIDGSPGNGPTTGSTTQTSGQPPSFTPNDPGTSHHAGGWELLQWNFLPGVGINAPEAWANLIADGRPGGKGVVIAILDTGIAYRNWHHFRRSPDFGGTKFIDPHDFVAGNGYPLDREGHGTFVAGTIAETTNNGIGLTGLAYGASIMPVRVLDKNGWGDAVTISRGIRYAVTHGAQVINLSLEFDPSVTAGDIPTILSAIRFAHRHGVVVVSVSGNEGSHRVAYPARAPAVISVGATTKDKCLADYSNGGKRLNIVAPGGGDDSSLVTDPDCDPARNLPDIFQETFFDPARPWHFGFPRGWFGTSMAAPEVAAAAALVIASGVIGSRPSPDQILARLEQTAQPLGGSTPNENYGYGLLDVGAATAPAS